ncbi:MAG: galactokinase [Actinomycetota bacterium]|nr:galactokinase [Actinomycetota bacterium]
MSFLGGGSDYPTYFNEQPGAVLGTAVSLYVFVALIQQNPLVDKQYKLTYRQSEAVDHPSELQHPVVRAVLQDQEWTGPGLHIATLADVPANTGLGSSSSFTVALLHALALFQGRTVTAETLARDAVRIEREVLNEAGGWQDQFHAAYGGTALYEFEQSGVVRRPLSTTALTDGLDRSMVLVPTGQPRSSHAHATSTTTAIRTRQGASVASEMANLARETYNSLRECDDPSFAIRTLAKSMDSAWHLKKALMGEAINEDADELISAGIRNGALAGRLCGAGGSGFVLFLTEIDDREAFIERSGLTQGTLINVSDAGSCHGPMEWM